MRLIQSEKWHFDEGRWSLILCREDKGKRCQGKFCRRPKRIERRKNGRYIITHSTCQTCQYQVWRANNPEKNAYKNLRQRARSRGKSFTISFEDFCAFIRGTDYLSRGGRRADQLHIDRKDNSKGYEAGNLQILTCSDNSSKNDKEMRRTMVNTLESMNP